MTAREKIDFIIKEIRELARLNPVGSFITPYISLSPTYVLPEDAIYPEEAVLAISTEERISILFKFQQDSLIKDLDISENSDFAYFSIDKLEIDSDETPYVNSKSGTVLPEPAKSEETDLDRGILILQTGQTVYLTGLSGRENNAVRLFRTLVSNPDKEWSEDEILEDWEGANCIMNPKLSERIYQAYIALAEKVQNQTDIADFIGVRNKNYRLNTKYLIL